MRRRSGTLAVLWAAACAASSALGRDRDLLPPPPRPDVEFYLQRLAPWVDATCVACHRAGGGELRFDEPAAGATEEQRRRADFERLVPFVNPDAPWDSRLLLKVLAPADGGMPHVGGPLVKPDTDEHDVLLDFVSGATLQNLPPEVWVAGDLKGKPGKPLVVDGRGSFDRDRGDVLAFRWQIFATPPGSRVALSDVQASRLELTPDVGGTYVLRLRVGDGKVWSAPREVSIEVFERVEAEERLPGGPSGLDRLDPDSLRRIRRLYLDLLGRAPTPAEAVAEESQAWERIVPGVLARADVGRAWYEDACERMGLTGDLRPTGEDAAGLALRVVAEGLTPDRAEAVLARDPAFLRAHPPGRALAEAIAGVLLGRAATPEEVRAGVALAAGGGADVPGLGPVADGAEWVRRTTDLPTFREAALRRRLGRFVPSGTVERLLSPGLRAVSEGPKAWRPFLERVFLEEEYRSRRSLRPKEELTFLRSLFVDLLERRPTDRELGALAAAARVLPGRSAPFSALVKVLLDSGEATLPLLVDIPDARAWIVDRFLRYLGRRPTPAELEAFGKALLHPAGGPEVVVRALLTSPEYACR